MLDLDYKEVAEKYGGNKQKIAQAAALGALGPEGPLLAVTAGMYIDRMRAAQMQEQAPQQTVAQQVLAPQQAATPQMPQGGPGLSGIAPPVMGAPAMGAPSAPVPAAAPPVGMAEGGYLPPYASGGLTDLPLPDGMFDEPGNGGFGDGYSGGGLVAFAEGGSTQPYYMQGVPETFYGYSATDPRANLKVMDDLFGVPQTKYADEAEQEFLRRRGEEYKKTQRRKDMGQLMAEAGFGMMAGNSPFALQNIGAAVLPALSNANERAKDRRAEEREIQRGLLDIEAGRNTAAAQRAQRALQAQETGVRGMEAEMGRRVTTGENERDRLQRRWEVGFTEAGADRRSRTAAASRGGDGAGGDGRGSKVTANRYTELVEAREGAAKDLSVARNAWIKAGRPKNSDRNPLRAAIAQSYLDAEGVYTRYNDLIGSVNPRGGAVPASAGKAVKNGQIVSAVPIPK